jgi:tetratricopeptide (TPR) repeat protein
MTKRLFLTGAILLLYCSLGGALDIGPDAYGSISDIYKVDDNAGLTAFPVLRVPMGGRAEGMGTAFSAVADDLTFIEWNPAGSSMLANTELGFYHNNWIADTKVEGIVFASRLKNLGYGGAIKWLYTPFSEYNMYGERVSKGYYSEAVATLNISYNFLAGYYFSGISLGANIKGAFRFMPDFSDADDQGNNQGSVISGSGRDQSAGMVMMDLGALTRFNLLKFYNAREKNTSLALVIRNLGPLSKEEPLPTSVTAALAYKPFRPLTLAFDYTYPLNMQDFSLSEKPFWAAGANVNITNFLSMRAGVLGRYGGYRVTIGSAVDLGKIALDLNYSLDLLTQITPLNRISLGVRFNFGDKGRQELSDQVDALYLSGLDAYSIGDIAQAQADWEEALRLNPRFDPAKEGLTLIMNSENLEGRINTMQTLEDYN